MKLADAVELYRMHCRLRGWWKPEYRNAGIRWFLKTCRRKRLDPCVPSAEEVHRLLAWPPEDTPLGLRRRGLWELAYGTGLRLGELLALNLSDLDL